MYEISEEFCVFVFCAGELEGDIAEAGTGGGAGTSEATRAAAKKRRRERKKRRAQLSTKQQDFQVCTITPGPVS